jgi:pseudouridine-5'-phosphate glycosidase
MAPFSMKLGEEVSAALARNAALVALESTVIAQGLPWPENRETALAMEAAVRSTGAVPATIAVIEGVIQIGLDDHESNLLANSRASEDRADGTNNSRTAKARIQKANRRDLSAIIASKQTAATTVSATLWIARRFGLSPGVMATGGLGGVHRNASSSFDVSTDLDELARADGWLVVCSGFKSILDLPATLENLETRGAVVIGYRTNELPGFLAESSGLPLEHSVWAPAEAAALVRTHRALNLPGAVVLVQPVPCDRAVDRSQLDRALEQALEQARLERVTGKALTPFLLSSVREFTDGQGLTANRALLVSNARLAAEIAVELDHGRGGTGSPAAAGFLG